MDDCDGYHRHCGADWHGCCTTYEKHKGNDTAVRAVKAFGIPHRKKASDRHEKIFTELDEHTERLGDHEHRIQNLENKK